MARRITSYARVRTQAVAQRGWENLMNVPKITKLWSNTQQRGFDEALSRLWRCPNDATTRISDRAGGLPGDGGGHAGPGHRGRAGRGPRRCHRLSGRQPAGGDGRQDPANGTANGAATD